MHLIWSIVLMPHANVTIFYFSTLNGLRQDEDPDVFALDYSNIKDWTNDLVVSNVNLIRGWKIGLEFQRAVVEIDVDFEINVQEKIRSDYEEAQSKAS